MRTLLTIGLVSLAAALLTQRTTAQTGGQKPPSDPKQVVANLVKDLTQTAEPERRVQGAIGLAEFGALAEPAIGPLVKALGSMDEDLALNAAIALSKIGKAANPALRAVVDGADNNARFYAVWALGWIGPDARDASPRLIQAMTDKDASIRRKAAYALSRVAVNPQKSHEVTIERQAIGILIAAFKDADEGVRQAAGDAVAKFGKAAVPKLLDALKNADVTVRVHAAQAVAEMGTDARDTAPVLRDLLLSKGSEPQALVYAQALAKLGKAGVPALIDAFKDNRPNVLQASVQSLSQVGADAVPALVDALSEKQVEVRRLAAQVLQSMRVSDNMVVTALAYAVKNDEDAQVRLLCIQALGGLGISGKLGAPALHHVLTDANNFLRVQAYYSLLNMGENPRDGLLKALRHKDIGIRVHTASLMLQVGVEADPAVPVLLDAMKHDKDTVRMQAALGLALPGREAGKLLPFFKDSLKSKDASTRIQALQGLAMLNQQAGPALGEVIAALKDPDASVRNQAVQTLQQLPESNAIMPALTKLYKEEKNQQIRLGIVMTVNRYGPGAMPLLLDAMKDGDAHIRQQTLSVLLNISGDLTQYHDEIVAAVKDKDVNVRMSFVNVLTRTGDKGMLKLGEMLSDPNQQVRWHAAMALQTAAKGAIKALPFLVAALNDKDANVRIHAGLALGQLGEDGAKVLAKAFSESKDAQPRIQILQAMLNSPARERGIPLLKRAVNDPNKEVRSVAIQMIPSLGATDEVVNILIDALKDKDLEVRVAAAYSFQQLGATGAHHLEIAMKSAKDGAVRSAILLGLLNQNHRSKSMLPSLIEYLKDGQPEVRWQAAQLLGNLGPDAKDALPMLKELINDTNPTVRQHAQAAINRIDAPKQ